MRTSGIDPVITVIDEENTSEATEESIPMQPNRVSGISSIWVTANLTDFFVENDNLKYRKDGSRIDIQGIVSPSIDIAPGVEQTIFVLPKSMWPPVPIRQVMPSNGINHWVIGIDLNGNVTFSNYGTNENVSCPSSEKLYINLSYYK